MWWAIIIIVVIVLLSMLFNVVKKKFVYFMVGFLLLITSILFVVSLAMIMRGYRKGANPNELSENDCMQALASIHQEEIGDMCKKGKYLGSNR